MADGTTEEPVSHNLVNEPLRRSHRCKYDRVGFCRWCQEAFDVPHENTHQWYCNGECRKAHTRQRKSAIYRELVAMGATRAEAMYGRDNKKKQEQVVRMVQARNHYRSQLG